MGNKPKLIRITTVNRSLNKLLEGQLAYMSKHFDVIGVSSPDETSDILRNREKVPIIDLPMSRKITPFKDLKAIYKMYRLFKKEKPDIIHSHTPKAGLVAMIAGKMANVPIRLHTIAGLPLETTTGIKRHILIFVEKLVYRMANYIYPNSHGIKDFILNKNLAPAHKVKIIGHGSSNGIDLTHFKKNETIEKNAHKEKQKWGITKQDKVFVFIGRLVVDKGITPLIDAWKKLETEFDNIKLVLVGPYEKNLSPLPPRTINEIDTSSSIIAVGHQKDVRPFFSLANFFVFPSYREGLPNVVLQAGALELPMIVTDINGNTDIVKDGINGKIIPPKNEQAIYDAMKLFLTNQKLVDTFKENARPTIEKKYDRKVLQAALLKEYQQLLKTHSKLAA